VGVYIQIKFKACVYEALKRLSYQYTPTWDWGAGGRNRFSNEKCTKAVHKQLSAHLPHAQIGMKTLKFLRLKDHSYALKFMLYIFLQLHIKFSSTERHKRDN